MTSAHRLPSYYLPVDNGMRVKGMLIARLILAIGSTGQWCQPASLWPLVYCHVKLRPIFSFQFTGGNHGHAGIIVEAAKYLTMTGGTQFDPPANPGVYSAGLVINAAAGTRTRKEAIHKELIAQYKIFKGVKQGLEDIIQEAVKADYLLEIKDDTLGFLNQTP
jgi:hypothetical protein